MAIQNQNILFLCIWFFGRFFIWLNNFLSLEFLQHTFGGFTSWTTSAYTNLKTQDIDCLIIIIRQRISCRVVFEKKYAGHNPHIRGGDKKK
ncbi:hypothetical protein ACJX0J_034625, partial [Zea mays]